MQTESTDTITQHLSIGDVSKICGVPIHTIRYWEQEFTEFLAPSRTPGKQRRYTDGDIEKLLEIKAFLWNNRFSIKGVRRILSIRLATAPKTAASLRPHSTSGNRLFMQLSQFGPNFISLNTVS